ncbi:DUF2752 domain-containing protein [Flavobacterium sp. I-SCBP12n]|uniref:DUF2752 domain-containing protein n=2 Tax=Flavobacterium TaxID=237 RepID=A0A9X1XMJ1_9FLAO|nr:MULTISPECIES: DUF2752 domain-containing protein [Flavobacterium]MBP4141042.1 DUF2752 domain-containing protein [Flavobacterium flabelliforme]MCK8140370.1 DUF2752 domain-containing protein [Flavobacterium pygoscelis]
MKSINYINSTKNKRKIYGIVGAILVLVIPFLLMLFNADNHLETDQSLCPFKMATGFPCPGCGITKSLVYLYQGDFYKSISYHVLGPFVIAFCLLSVAVLSLEIITKREYLNGIMYNKKLAYSLGFFLITYHIIRLILFIRNNSLDAILKESIWR